MLTLGVPRKNQQHSDVVSFLLKATGFAQEDIDDLAPILRELYQQTPINPNSVNAAIQIAHNHDDWRDYLTAENLQEFFGDQHVSDMLASAAHASGNMVDFYSAFFDFLCFRYVVHYAP